MISKKDIKKLEGLLYLYALSQTSSKREVAEKLGTSVDTINKYISDFEAEMQSRFLVSNGRGTVMTPEGKNIVLAAEDILRVVRRLGEYAGDVGSCKGTVRLAMPDAISGELVSGKLFELMNEYPDIYIENIISDNMPDMNVLEADVCIAYNPPENEDLIVISKYISTACLFASKKYVEKYGMPKDKQDLIDNHRLCIRDQQAKYNHEWRDIMKRAKKVVYRTNSIYSLWPVIQNGEGIGISQKDDVLQNEDNCHVLPELDFDITLYLIAHRNTKDIPKVRIVIDFIKSIFDNIH